MNDTLQDQIDRVVDTYAIKAYAPYVKKGVNLLNRVAPGWAKKITITDLDLASTYACVLGQLAAKRVFEDYSGHYSTAVNSLGINGSDYGFDEGDPESDLPESYSGYPALNHLWVAAIRLTRKGVPVTVRSLLDTVRY